jgi:molecular chaperone GrpE
MGSEERNAAEAARVAASEEQATAEATPASADGAEEILESEVIEEEPAAAGRETEEAAADVESDLDELGKTRQERDQFLELAQRTKADFENYRKRAARDAEQAAVRGIAKVATGVIPAIDNLERALSSAPGDDPLAKGVELVHKELIGALERAGVAVYDPTGEKFDPEWHEALQTRKAEGTEPGIVLETVEKGYRLDGQLLRAARVVVSE